MRLIDLIDGTLLRFLLVGAANTLFGAAVMFGLYNIAGFGYWAASAANYALGSVLSFFLNKYFTFRVRRWTLAQAVSFVVTIVLSYALAYGLAKPVVGWALRGSPRSVRENASLLAGMCLFTLLNYLGQRFVVFRKRGCSKTSVLEQPQPSAKTAREEERR